MKCVSEREQFVEAVWWLLHRLTGFGSAADVAMTTALHEALEYDPICLEDVVVYAVDKLPSNLAGCAMILALDHFRRKAPSLLVNVIEYDNCILLRAVKRSAHGVIESWALPPLLEWLPHCLNSLLPPPRSAKSIESNLINGSFILVLEEQTTQTERDLDQCLPLLISFVRSTVRHLAGMSAEMDACIDNSVRSNMICGVRAVVCVPLTILCSGKTLSLYFDKQESFNHWAKLARFWILDLESLEAVTSHLRSTLRIPVVFHTIKNDRNEMDELEVLCRVHVFQSLHDIMLEWNNRRVDQTTLNMFQHLLLDLIAHSCIYWSRIYCPHVVWNQVSWHELAQCCQMLKTFDSFTVESKFVYFNESLENGSLRYRVEPRTSTAVPLDKALISLMEGLQSVMELMKDAVRVNDVDEDVCFENIEQLMTNLLTVCLELTSKNTTSDHRKELLMAAMRAYIHSICDNYVRANSWIITARRLWQEKCSGMTSYAFPVLKETTVFHPVTVPLLCVSMESEENTELVNSAGCKDPQLHIDPIVYEAAPSENPSLQTTDFLKNTAQCDEAGVVFDHACGVFVCLDLPININDDQHVNNNRIPNPINATEVSQDHQTEVELEGSSLVAVKAPINLDGTGGPTKGNNLPMDLGMDFDQEANRKPDIEPTINSPAIEPLDRNNGALSSMHKPTVCNGVEGNMILSNGDILLSNCSVRADSSLETLLHQLKDYLTKADNTFEQLTRMSRKRPRPSACTDTDHTMHQKRVRVAKSMNVDDMKLSKSNGTYTNNTKVDDSNDHTLTHEEDQMYKEPISTTGYEHSCSSEVMNGISIENDNMKLMNRSLLKESAMLTHSLLGKLILHLTLGS